jgi:hypothetical protein
MGLLTIAIPVISIGFMPLIFLEAGVFYLT